MRRKVCQKKALVAYFEIQYRYLPGRTEESTENLCHDRRPRPNKWAVDPLIIIIIIIITIICKITMNKGRNY
jgi:t-SNARE complex subunit (syntaxin)